jgi:hypothetical protein
MALKFYIESAKKSDRDVAKLICRSELRRDYLIMIPNYEQVVQLTQAIET